MANRPDNPEYSLAVSLCFFALADVRGPGLKALATAARRSVCASVWFAQPAPLARCSPLSRAIYWQSSSHNRDTSQQIQHAASPPLPTCHHIVLLTILPLPSFHQALCSSFCFLFLVKTAMIIKSFSCVPFSLGVRTQRNLHAFARRQLRRGGCAIMQ
jgi:hypothetical protein